jgi:hypothetical protein
LSLEIAQIHAYWEDSLYAVTAFPKADEKNWRVLSMIEQIVEDRKLIGPGNDADKRVLVEVWITYDCPGVLYTQKYLSLT